MLRTVMILAALAALGAPLSAATIERSYSIPEPDEVSQGSYRTWYVPVTDAPAGAVIMRVEARFEYTAYGVVQNYVSARFNRASDPGSTGGALLVSQGSLPAGNPGAYGYVTFSNWNGMSVNTNYYFRFMLAAASPYTCTIHGISVRITYDVAPPTLYSPADFAIFNRYTTSTISFDWSDVSGATQYQINVFPSGNSGNPVIYTSTTISSYSSSTSIFTNGVYVWQVRALVGGAYTGWSSSRQFVVDVPPAPPPLTAPANGATFDLGVTTPFQWGNSPDNPISRYYLRIVPGTNLGAPPAYENELSGNLQNVVLSDASFDPGTYTWGLRAIKATPSGYNATQYETIVGWGSYNTRTFTIVIGAPDPPNLIFPANRSIYNRHDTSSISFGWSGDNDAIEYWLNVFPSGQSGSPKVNASVGNTTFYAVAVDASWVPGVYIWQVMVRTAGGWSDYSTAREFVVDIPPQAPMLSDPADGASFDLEDSGTFTWSGPAGVTVARYYFRLVAGTDLDAAPIHDLEPATSGMVRQFDDASFDPGIHTWGVRAIKVAPPGYDQPTYESTIGWGGYGTRELQIRTPVFDLLSPANGGTVATASIPFAWANAGAVRYELTVDDDADFSSPEIAPTDPNFRDIITTAKNIEGNWLPEGTWYWFVRAVRGDGSSITSATASFSYHPPALADPAWDPLYRLYNPTARDHFYCSSEAHQAGAMGEGYNAEGVEGHISYTPFVSPNMVPIYRFWHFDFNGGHYYVAGEAGREAAIQDANFRYEGITGYAYEIPLPGLVPLHHLRKDFTDGSGRRDNFYTTSDFEKENAVAQFGFTYLGVTAYVSPVGDLGPMPWSPYALMAGLGVSSDNGNFKHHQATGFDIPATGLPLRFSHQYNSRAVYYPDQLKSMGPGWSHDYSSCITEAAGLLYVCWASGATHLYDQATRACLVAGVYDELAIETVDRIRVTKKNQVSHLFERPDTGYPFMLREIRDRNGNTVTCTYETGGLRRLVRITGPAGRNLTIGYSTAAGQESLIRMVTDPAGRTIGFQYDPDTRDLVSYVDPAGHQTTYAYDPLQPHEHQLQTITLPDGTTIDNSYADRKLASQHWSGQDGGLNLAYNGNTTSVSYINSNRSYSVDFVGDTDPLQPRLPSSVVQNGHTTQFHYDNPNHPALPSSLTDPRGNSHFFYYDSRGNLIEESHPLGANTQYLYDSFNNVTRTTDPLSHATNYGYDSRGNLVSVTSAEGSVTSLTRDERGRVTQVTDYAGTTTFTYDTHGNLTSVTDPLSHQITFTVDNVGRVTAVTDANGSSTNYQVDARGLVTRVIDPLGGSMTFDYDENGELTTARGPGATSSAWTYNGGFLAAYQTPSHTADYSYNGDGTLQSRTTPLGTTGYTYDDAGLLNGINGANSAGITRDADGNIIAVYDASFNFSYQYDALDRVTRAIDHWGNSIDFEYDRAGNTTRIVYAPGKDVTYTYDLDNRLESVTDWNGRSTSYTYRPDGLVTRVDRANGTWTTFAYDGAGRLTQIVHGSDQGTIASYLYTLDAVGRQIGVGAVEPLGTPELASIRQKSTPPERVCRRAV